MRKISFTIPFVMVFFVALFYVGNVFSTTTEENEQVEPRTWQLTSLCDIKIMNIDSENITYSDIQKALLANRLKSGSLVVSLEVSFKSSEVIEDLKSADLKFKVKDMELENHIKNLTVVGDKSLNGVWNFDLSKLYNGQNEDNLIMALKDLTDGNYSNCKIKTDFKNLKSDKSVWTDVSRN